MKYVSRNIILKFVKTKTLFIVSAFLEILLDDFLGICSEKIVISRDKHFSLTFYEYSAEENVMSYNHLELINFVIQSSARKKLSP